MELEARLRINGTDTFIAYSDKFLDADDPDDTAELDKFKEAAWPEKQEDPGYVLSEDPPTYLFVVEDIEIEFEELSLFDPAGGYESLEASREGKSASNLVSFKFAYFFDGTHALYKGHESETKNIMKILLSVCVPILLLTVVFLILSIFLIKDTSEKIT